MKRYLLFAITLVLAFTSCSKDQPKNTGSETAKAYADGEYRIYQQSTKENPVVLVFTGDGYTPDMFEFESGKFDTDINRAIEALFAIEPYKTFREYFTVYKIAAYSNETGVSIKRPSRKYKDTRFKCMWENKTSGGSYSTLIECNTDSVEVFWSKIPGLDSDAAQTYAPICIVVNDEIRAGTVQTIPTDLSVEPFGGLYIKSIAMVPLGNGSQSFESIIQHEYGGHAFGFLADEYSSGAGGLADEVFDFYKAYQSYGPLGFGLNVSFEANVEDSPWAELAEIERYKNAGIGMYEGALGFSSSVWRSEYDSCMKNNKPFFNAQSRYLIYKRIMLTAGEEASLQDFVSRDNETQYAVE